jgi:hypothetical protein
MTVVTGVSADANRVTGVRVVRPNEGVTTSATAIVDVMEARAVHRGLASGKTVRDIAEAEIAIATIVVVIAEVATEIVTAVPFGTVKATVDSAVAEIATGMTVADTATVATARTNQFGAATAAATTALTNQFGAATVTARIVVDSAAVKIAIAMIVADIAAAETKTPTVITVAPTPMFGATRVPRVPKIPEIALRGSAMIAKSVRKNLLGNANQPRRTAADRRMFQ